MIFRIENYLSNPEIVVKHDDKEVRFNISFINKFRPQEFKTPESVQNIFYALNKFIQSKPKEWQDRLFHLLEKAKELNAIVATRKSLLPLPTDYVHEILDMLNPEEIHDFIIKNRLITPPYDLKEEFDESMVRNKEGTREQTYLKSDFLRLISLLTALRAVWGPLAEFALFKQGQIPPGRAEYILINFFVDHPIWDDPAFVKLREYVSKLSDIALLDEEEVSKLIIKNPLPKDELKTYVLALALFQKLLPNDDTDPKDLNLVKKLYKIIKSKLNIRDGNVSSSDIRIKRYNMKEDGESESIMEMYRVPTDITIGFEKEFQFSASDPVRIAKEMNVKDIKKVLHIRDGLRMLENAPIPPESIDLLTWLAFSYPDPRGIYYLNLDGLLNLMAATSQWLIENGFLDLALILTSYELTGEVYVVNTTNKTRLDPELVKKIEEYYPYKKIAGEKEKCPVEEAILDLSNRISGKNLFTTLPEMEGVVIPNRHISIPEDIRNILASAVIRVYEYL